MMDDADRKATEQLVDEMALDCLKQVLVERGRPDDASSMMEEIIGDDHLMKEIEKLHAVVLSCFKHVRDQAAPDAQVDTLVKRVTAVLVDQVQRRPDLAEAVAALIVRRAVVRKIGV
jgi:hypothetical protein